MTCACRASFAAAGVPAGVPLVFAESSGPNVGQRALSFPIRLYRRYLSPLKPAPSCRFHPTCSAYALEAIAVHGAMRGLALSVWRLLKCQPFHPGGFDPVPPARGSHDGSADASAVPGSSNPSDVSGGAAARTARAHPPAEES